MKSTPRVVLDTNVALSALLFARGRLAPLRDAWYVQRFVPLLSRNTASELVRVLRYPKFRLSTGEQQELLADLLSRPPKTAPGPKRNYSRANWALKSRLWLPSAYCDRLYCSNCTPSITQPS